jgi:heme a synthase
MSSHFSAAAWVGLVGALLALAPMTWVWWRSRAVAPTDRSAKRLQALTVLTLFLTFDLVLFGAFTRLTDSGLGCPDWPGCYGSATPLGAQHHIQTAQDAMPSGPVTHGKAWIEMIHRYMATAVGVLIVMLFVLSWRQTKQLAGATAGLCRTSLWWAAATLVWVCVQGAFGALTVTMKLYPAIVTLHLLGGMGLLALLAVQVQSHHHRAVMLSAALRSAVWCVALLAVAQIALGGWVSTNYAVLACTDFPTCQGEWWPPMNFEEGFAVDRALGANAHGEGYLPFAALTAIHITHRLAAGVLLVAMALLAWRLHRVVLLRRWAWGLAAVALWQLCSGLGNVLLGWPLLAAIAHTGGAAALVMLLAALLCKTHAARAAVSSSLGPPCLKP